MKTGIPRVETVPVAHRPLRSFLVVKLGIAAAGSFVNGFFFAMGGILALHLTGVIHLR